MCFVLLSCVDRRWLSQLGGGIDEIERSTRRANKTALSMLLMFSFVKEVTWVQVVLLGRGVASLGLVVVVIVVGVVGVVVLVRR